ncbi:ATP-binding protein [Brevibacterium spongiae]|uniref:ATP-binding protein n=1 Tax=Brevibacterium spongiae TaxID=2909672 RepID=A0ABY5SUJ9_9MICO|nr:ATP-binding protein [Brevibacterium spongiae]UVI36726.1 ATP-binding protein [Brevibacterium spongiae]
MADPNVYGPSPFTPGYSKPPLVFGGHQSELNEITEVFRTLDFGENDSLLVSGLRGSGKTSMLSRLQDAAREAGWIVLADDASSGLMERITESSIPREINRLTETTRARLSSIGIWKFSVGLEYVDRSRTVKPLLRDDLIALSTALNGEAGVLITIDEVSSGKVRLRELSRFALEVAHAKTEGANIMIAFAGIKVDLDELAKNDHTTFIRRSRDLDFRRLNPKETRHVLEETIRIAGRSIAPEALELLVRVTQGYPYLIQLAGDYAWRNTPTEDTISVTDAQIAHDKAIKSVQRRVISRVYEDLSDRDRDFVNAMAVDESGRSKISDIADRMGTYGQYAQIYKTRLINSGYVQSDGWGYVAFSLPYLGDYIRSMTPQNPATSASVNDWSAYPPPPTV